jgi:serine/threonine protein kinase
MLVPDSPTPPPRPDAAEAPTVPPRQLDTRGDAAAPAVTPADASTQDLPPPDPEVSETFGRYRIERLLGRGGMGSVYLAQDTLLGRPVALKVPVLEAPAAAAVRARFFREAQAAAALMHPNICPIHDVGEIDGVPYLTMAYLDGEPLSRRLARGPLAVADALNLVHTLAGALAYAHARGVIHRDLKPGNVMIDGRGQPVLMDFGLARRADHGAQLTQQGEVLGTPAYMPPEQVLGDVAAMGPASDVYSLGVLLYELLSGTTPFKGDLLALVAQIPLDEPPPPSTHRSGLDPRLDAVCLKALAKDPANRWPSMTAFANALAACREAPAAAAESLLTLRVLGTPYAYRPAPGQDVITVGRQKRRPGDPSDHGNDLVVRVPGNDQLSARISRRHLEIHHSAEGFAVVDCSKAGTLLNGQPLPRNVPTPLAAGDRLLLAGVVTLEVVLLSPTNRKPPTFAAVTHQSGGNPIVFEATLGDLLTLE